MLSRNNNGKNINAIIKQLDILEEKIEYYDLRKINIAHVMLARRQAKRDPGNAFSSNDRVPYCFIEIPKNKSKNILQGDRIETPKFIQDNDKRLDYLYYIQKQMKKPIKQLFEQIIPTKYKTLFDEIERIGKNRKLGQSEITNYLSVAVNNIKKISILDSDSDEDMFIQKKKRVRRKKRK